MRGVTVVGGGRPVRGLRGRNNEAVCCVKRAVPRASIRPHTIRFSSFSMRTRARSRHHATPATTAPNERRSSAQSSVSTESSDDSSVHDVKSRAFSVFGAVSKIYVSTYVHAHVRARAHARISTHMHTIRARQKIKRIGEDTAADVGERCFTEDTRKFGGRFCFLCPRVVFFLYSFTPRRIPLSIPGETT